MKIRVLFFLFAGLAGVAGAAAAPASPRRSVETEYDVKAVFLLNFTRFIEWPAQGPAENDKPFVIGILGVDPFGHRLDEAVRGETVNGRPFVVKRLREIEDASGCDAVFVSRSEAEHVRDIVKQLDGQAVLTVSDIPDFAENGGIVGLVRDHNKIRLHINVEASKAANLTISSKLLRPALIVSTRKTSLYDPAFASGLLALGS
jgi:hypothetical protein